MARRAAVAVAMREEANSHELDKLRKNLLENLTSTISDTVEMVCEEFEESFAQATQSHQPTNGAVLRGGKLHINGDTKLGSDRGVEAAMEADYDLYYSCCQRLVTYIAINMATSGDFVQQMDRIILACHSNASERVLRSVVTKDLWFRRKAEGEEELSDGEREDDMEDQSPPYLKPSVSRVKEQVAVRGTKRREPPLPPPPPAASTRRNAKAKSQPQPPKRARREVAARKTRYVPSDDDDEEDDDEIVQPKIAPRRRQNRVHYSEDEDEEMKRDGGDDDDEDEDDGVEFVKHDATQQPHYGQADELLSFKDAIGDMCYPERRTTAQTRFFKERLRKAIEFVDAQLCKPPKGKTCAWGCVKIRRQMCNRDLPCRNKVCRMWHDVEAHTDRCQNSHCEFRIRVMLRETMYKIDHKKMELLDNRNELHTKKKKILDLKHENLSDRESYVERRLLDNEIGQLENDIEEGEKDLGMFKATKKAYWATLNEIGITVDDDANDQFPEFNGHYVAKKTAAKKKTPTKAARKDDEYTPSSTPTKTPPSSSRSERTRRRLSVDNPHNEASANSTPSTQRERITRRSTQQSMQAMTSGVIELDDDEEEEETKTDRSVEADEDKAGGDEDKGGGDGDEDMENSVADADGAREDVEESTEAMEDDQPATTADNDETAQGGDESHATDEGVTATAESNGASEELTTTNSMPSALAGFNQVLNNLSASPSTASPIVGAQEPTSTYGGAGSPPSADDNVPLLPF